MSNSATTPDLLIVGAGPAGSAAAIHAARAGLTTVLADAASFPRDKTCGDGLTPRAIHQLSLLGIDATSHYSNQGLRLHGFGASVEAPWPASTFGRVGSAMPRTELDQRILDAALAHPEVTFLGGNAAQRARVDHRLQEVTFANGERVRPKHVIVADGVRSTFGKQLGRTWHKEEVYGIAARAYCTTEHSREPWIHSHLELRDQAGTVQPGYGWIFPLGQGEANVGCGALSTTKRPAKVNTKKLLEHYASQCREEWGFGAPTRVASALLPMGGAVSNVAGPNWMLIGDAAACVNPLNGEGIDYGMETAAHAVSLIAAGTTNFTRAWPALLREHYGRAFVLARSAARLLTYPQFLPAAGPLAMRGPLGRRIMPTAARLMGNLVTEEDHDVVARAWHGAGSAAERLRGERPLWG